MKLSTWPRVRIPKPPSDAISIDTTIPIDDGEWIIVDDGDTSPTAPVVTERIYQIGRHDLVRTRTTVEIEHVEIRRAHVRMVSGKRRIVLK